MSAPLRVVGLSGNHDRPSRSGTLMALMAEQVARLGNIDLSLFDLASFGPSLGSARRRSDLTMDAAGILSSIEACDLLLTAFPVYNASYPGLYKHAVDFLDRGAMQHKPVLIGAVGCSLRYSMVPEIVGRPLFLSLSAIPLPPSIYVASKDPRDVLGSRRSLLKRIDDALSHLPATALDRLSLQR